MTGLDLHAVGHAADTLFAADASHGLTLALVVMQRGEVVFERYGHQPDTAFGPGGPVTADTTLVSWSMAKSITHAAVGVLVGEGRLQLDAPAPVAGWAGTPKERITLQHLLDMMPGLEFVEDYVDAGISHCIEMLYGSGQHDMAAYAAALPLVHEPGTVWNYSSGTTNIVARIVGDVVGGGRAGMEAFLSERIFGPSGMHSAIPKFDEVGTFVGSSFVYATARDFARFGELYRLDGVGADGTRVLPAGWTDHARTQVATDPESGFGYGAHWWLWPQFPGSLACHGYEGQYTLVVPDRELVVVHLGKCPADVRPQVNEVLADIVTAAS
ncbi:MAG TPA: serine hydrolase, partial [Acidimicrobiaceae bacterium]|nr:serine hydrolase [Acidimicrobiaceae bacterium]